MIVVTDNFVLPDERSHVRLTPIRESTKMSVAPIPLHAARHLFDLHLLQRVDVFHARCEIFAAEMHLELRFQSEEEHLVLCAAVSMPSSVSFKNELKNPMLPG